jgi:hypothetical protein
MNGGTKMKEINENLKLLPQEVSGDYRFSGKMYLTIGLIATFGDDAKIIALMALKKVQTERVNTPTGTDYLQVFSYNDKRFWLIDDVTHITALLPSDY